MAFNESFDDFILFDRLNTEIHKKYQNLWKFIIVATTKTIYFCTISFIVIVLLKNTHLAGSLSGFIYGTSLYVYVTAEAELEQSYNNTYFE